MEPTDVGIALEPSHLFAGINAGVLLDFLDGKVQIPFTVQVFEHFFVAYGVQRVEVLVGIHASGFFQEAVLHHDVHPSVDAVVEFLAVAGQPHFDDVERSFLGATGAVLLKE